MLASFELPAYKETMGERERQFQGKGMVGIGSRVSDTINMVWNWIDHENRAEWIYREMSPELTKASGR